MEDKNQEVTKICSKCKQEKYITNFCKNRTKSDGYNIYCHSCKKIIDKLY